MRAQRRRVEGWTPRRRAVSVVEGAELRLTERRDGDDVGESRGRARERTDGLFFGIAQRSPSVPLRPHARGRRLASEADVLTLPGSVVIGKARRASGRETEQGKGRVVMEAIATAAAGACLPKSMMWGARHVELAGRS